MNNTGGLILNFFFPGLGTLIVGRQKEGVAQLILYAIGCLLTMTIILAIIGIPLMMGAWIWSLVCLATDGGGSNGNAVPQVVVHQHVGDVRYNPSNRPMDALTEMQSPPPGMSGQEFVISTVVPDGRTVRNILSVSRPRFSVGRRSDSARVDLQLNDSAVSRSHARFELRDGKVWIVDLGSSNGTIFRNRRIGRDPVQLRPGDSIQVGSAVLTLSMQ